MVEFKNSSQITLLTFTISLFLTLFLSWHYYQDDLSKLTSAYNDKIKLYPPTDYEVARWEAEHRRLEIQQKQKEIVLLRMNISIPDDIDKDVLAHLDKYPDGHNPPKTELQRSINSINDKKTKFYLLSLGFSILASFIAGIVAYEKEKRKCNFN